MRPDHSIATPFDRLDTLSNETIATWGRALTRLQVRPGTAPGLDGGLLCPACARIHGRCYDAMFAFLYMARMTGDHAYADAAWRVFTWSDNVSRHDGAFYNDVAVDLWVGITVFAVVSLGESYRHYRDILGAAQQQRLYERIMKAGTFLYSFFTPYKGNINYPITCAYALRLLHTLGAGDAFRHKAQHIMDELQGFYTPHDGLLAGEGQPYDSKGAQGSPPVDLAYNVEETLGSLVMYGLLTEDETLLERVRDALNAHMRFMLPDGAWDDSWGTRMYKWTYWGSRTCDGCQVAYGLMGFRDRNEQFAEVALRNLRLLDACTHQGLLYGGPQYVSHGVLPCIHHTFCHAKGLALLQRLAGRDTAGGGKERDRARTANTREHTDAPDRDATITQIPAWSDTNVVLPRDDACGVTMCTDINTCLVAHGPWRATITAYDWDMKKDGHPTGGALSLLWHETAGPLLAGTMRDYRLIEPANMQVAFDDITPWLTPRLEVREKDAVFAQANYLRATLQHTDHEDGPEIVAHTALVDADQHPPAAGEMPCELRYRFTRTACIIHAHMKDTAARRPVTLHLPVIAPSTAHVAWHNERSCSVSGDACTIQVLSTIALRSAPDAQARVFSHVGGFEAIALYGIWDQSETPWVEVHIAAGNQSNGLTS